MIRLDNVSRWYGLVIGVNDITATLSPGITALIGQNGAGKSTLIKLITGQIRPTTGNLTVNGETPFANPAVFKHLGYCPEIDNFYEYLTGRQFVTHMARLQGFSKEEAKTRSDDMIRRVGMAERCDKAIQGYSKGMRQRIKLAQAMLHEPDVLLLDEPLNGLDPVGRKEFIDVLAGLEKEGKTILISSHILFEVETLTRNIILLHRGRLLASGNLTTIRELIDRHPHRIRIETTDPRAVAATVVSLPGVKSVSIPDETTVEVETAQTELFYAKLGEIANDPATPILSFHSPDNNMESVFQYLVGSR